MNTVLNHILVILELYLDFVGVMPWLLNWQIMSQLKYHNFKILLQTTNNFTFQTRFPGKIESRFVKTRQFLFSLEMYSSLPTMEAKDRRRLRGVKQFCCQDSRSR